MLASVCDGCGRLKEIRYKLLSGRIDGDSKYYCERCAGEVDALTNKGGVWLP